jgi:hypothetical protein
VSFVVEKLNNRGNPNVKSVLTFALIFMCSSVAGAQTKNTEHGEAARHPNDPISYRFVFEGRDAATIQTVRVIWETDAAPNRDQQGFQTEFDTTAAAKEPRTFEVNYRVPLHVATGRYHVRLRADLQGGGFISYSSDELSLPELVVDNPQVFEKPHVKAEEIRPQP